MIKDPGFEYVTSPGIPTSCYASNGGDRGATYFLDPRDQAEGGYSLRLQTPAEGKSISIKLFPVMVSTGSSYLVSIWAKSDPEQRFLPGSVENSAKEEVNQSPQYAEISLGDFGSARFIPDAEWRQYVGVIEIPPDTVPKRKTNLILRMPGQGVGWFDMIQMVEDPLKKQRGDGR